MFKKILIGCGILALLMFLAGVGVAIWAYAKIRDYAKQQEQIRVLVDSTRRDYPFTAPNPPIMKADRLKTALAVRQAVVDAVGSRLDVLADLGSALQGGPEAAKSLDLGTLLGASRQAIALPKHVGRALAAALIEHKMSADEYVGYARVFAATSMKTALKDAKTREAISEFIGQVEGQTGLNLAGGAGGEGAKPDPEMLLDLIEARDIPLLDENARLAQEALNNVNGDPRTLWVDFFILKQTEAFGPAADRIMNSGQDILPDEIREQNSALFSPAATPAPATP